jgi:phosphate transport system permease protein
VLLIFRFFLFQAVTLSCNINVTLLTYDFTQKHVTEHIMPQIKFSLKIADRKRLLKDRLIRYAVRAGGVSVLGALVLIFVYLAWVVIPLFHSAKVELSPTPVEVSQQVPVLLSVNESGQYAFILDQQGMMAYWSLHSSAKQPVWQQQLPFVPYRSAVSAQGHWFAALGDALGDTLGDSPTLVIGRPYFYHDIVSAWQQSDTRIERLHIPESLRRQLPQHVKRMAFTVTKQFVKLAVLSSDGILDVWSYQRAPKSPHLSRYRFPHSVDADELLMTPDGQTLYIREGSELVIAKHIQSQYRVQEVVDLTERRSGRQVVKLNLLAGGASLLVTHRDNTVSQWFDVVKQGKKHLTHIRDFDLGQSTLLLPEPYHKGFFCFYPDGQVRSYYASTRKLLFSGQLFEHMPQSAALSDNEKYLVTYRDKKLQIARVDLGYPEISFSALWQRIWYENYPAPDYVWQSTSDSDRYEPKFSLVPIAFGTIKAALYSMCFSIPVAVLAAIYTAYFMSPRMRGKVKPTIELMEALPTVIIGFLAGLWLAPIVERHLVSVGIMFVLLPVVTILFGGGWYLFPARWRSLVGKGWHAALLMPVLALVVVVSFSSISFHLESWLFGGDIRVFLARYGINFDQRNALIVGFAMGFAVIPTIFSIAEDAIFSVPKHLSDGSMALGATQWQTLVHVVLLTASPGIFSAIMMGLGRAVGETMIVLMATGNTPIMNWNIFEGMRTIAATIAVELSESEVGSSQYRLLFLAALILFIFTFLVNALAEWIRLRLREKYRAL